MNGLTNRLFCNQFSCMTGEEGGKCQCSKKAWGNISSSVKIQLIQSKRTGNVLSSNQTRKKIEIGRGQNEALNHATYPIDGVGISFIYKVGHHHYIKLRHSLKQV